MAIAIFGSLNMDWVVSCPHLPQPGETLLGHQFSLVPGGKGGNQGVAAARLGARTRFIGAVGSDGFGDALVSSLQREGVDTRGITRWAKDATGIAAIAVADSGENHIIVVPGANGSVGDEALTHLAQGLGGDRLLLLQLEVPLASVLKAAGLAKAQGVTVILDPAPAPPNFPPEFYRLVDILTPNQGEAAQLVGHPVQTQATAAQAAQTLWQRGIATVIITLGAQGCLACYGGELWYLPPFPVIPVDTVAAGDAFNGGLAVALGERQPWPEALRWAGAAGAIATTQSGAQSALPSRAQVLDLLANYPQVHPYRL